MNEIRVHAPATVSNVVCGFDCLGFALSEPYDVLVVRVIGEPTIRIINRDDFRLPTDPSKNVIGVTLQAMRAAADLEHGFEVEVTKHIKPGSGIGSSAASSCGAAYAANKLIGDLFSKSQLVQFAMEGENLASGARHADNVAPCIFGGFVLVRSTEPLDVVELDHPPLWVTVIHPQIEIMTAEARAILPKDISLKDAVKQWSNLGSLVSALSTGDLELMARSMEDVIVEPVRKKLIPKFDEAMGASQEAGAIGSGISGSGPSMFALSDSPAYAESVREAFETVYVQTGIEFRTYVSAIGESGVREAI